jgi:hypothetical protein
MSRRFCSLFDKQQIAEHFRVRRIAGNVAIIDRPTTWRLVTSSL